VIMTHGRKKRLRWKKKELKIGGKKKRNAKTKGTGAETRCRGGSREATKPGMGFLTGQAKKKKKKKHKKENGLRRKPKAPTKRGTSLIRKPKGKRG